LACDRDFPCTELAIPDAEQLVSWDEGEILNVMNTVVFAFLLQIKHCFVTSSMNTWILKVFDPRAVVPFFGLYPVIL